MPVITWLSPMPEFISRRLTFESDRLPAISALAKEPMSPETGKYFAGLWEKEMSLQLLWHCGRSIPKTKRPMEYRAPTWSWASVVELELEDPESKGTGHMDFFEVWKEREHI